MREDVYARILKVVENRAIIESLSPLDRRLVERIDRDYRRSGLRLDRAKREELRKIKQELAELASQFSRHISEEDAEVLYTRGELSGMPDSFFDGRETRVDDADGVEKFVVTTKYPDLYPVLMHAKRWQARKALKLKEETRCPENIAIIEKAIKLRYQAAQLMGYRTHADYQLEIMMAKKPDHVTKFESDLRARLNVLAELELKTMDELKAEELESFGEPVDTTLYSWDYLYYKNLIKERQYNVSDEEVKQYLSMENVTKGILDTYQHTLGLRFVRSSEPGWHKDVFVYEVWDAKTGEFVGHFLMDLYPREGKYNHAACFPIRSGFERPDGTREYPVAAI
ncbi:metalloendopeptidase, partial [Spiromyces aspiralis]